VAVPRVLRHVLLDEEGCEGTDVQLAGMPAAAHSLDEHQLLRASGATRTGGSSCLLMAAA
jgi:hypothetical protein